MESHWANISDRCFSVIQSPDFRRIRRYKHSLSEKNSQQLSRLVPRQHMNHWYRLGRAKDPATDIA